MPQNLIFYIGQVILSFLLTFDFCQFSACESSEIEALSGSNFLSCVSSNDDLTEFLQTSYVTAASLVSNYQDESRRVIKSILAEFSICCLELQV